MHNLSGLPKNAIALILAVVICALFSCHLAFAEPDDQSTEETEWNSVTSNCFNIYYRPDANLPGIERELKTRTLYFDQPARYGEVTSADEICYRLDKLFNHVKDLLSMYPEIPKVLIKIFRDREELNEEYYKIFSKREDLSAYYIKDYNTIYTSESDIGDSVMIHEMAHVIIDHYFSVDPPEKVSEILATFVDVHMEEE